MIGETYINRHLEAVLSNAAETFKVVVFASNQARHFFESWVVGQIVRAYQAGGLDFSNDLYYYRDDAMREIDLLISRSGRLYPVEIKMSSNLGTDAMRHFAVIDEMGVERAPGCVLSLTQNPIPVRDRGLVVKVATLWEQGGRATSRVQ